MVEVGGREVPAAELVERINVHGYEEGLDPGRDNDARRRLRESAGTKTIWVTEYGDDDDSGMTMPQTITEDITNLRAAAWLYWQVVEPDSAWGLVNAHFGDGPDSTDRGAPTWSYAKYYVMAQFTRFIRPGATILGSTDHNTITAWDEGNRSLSFVTVNFGTPQPITYDLSGWREVGDHAEITVTQTDGSQLFERTEQPVIDGRVRIEAEPKSVYSIVIRGVSP